MVSVYQSVRKRYIIGVASAIVLHVLLAVLLQLLDIQRPSVPEYSEVVTVDLADYASDTPEPEPEPEASAREPEPAPAPETQPETPAEPQPETQSPELEYRYQQEIPNAALPDADERAEPGRGDAHVPQSREPSAPQGPTEAEIAFRRQNLEALQDWLDSQPDLSRPTAARDQPEAAAEAPAALSDERLQEIDRVLSSFTGPDQQVRSINLSQAADSETAGESAGDTPQLAGDRERISGDEPRLTNTLLRESDPPVLSAMVSFIVNPRGRVVDLQFEKSSGNNEIDARIRSAIQSWRFSPSSGSSNARGEITYTIRRVQ